MPHQIIPRKKKAHFDLVYSRLVLKGLEQPENMTVQKPCDKKGILCPHAVL